MSHCSADTGGHSPLGSFETEQLRSSGFFVDLMTSKVRPSVLFLADWTNAFSYSVILVLGEGDVGLNPVGPSVSPPSRLLARVDLHRTPPSGEVPLGSSGS